MTPFLIASVAFFCAFVIWMLYEIAIAPLDPPGSD